MYVCMYVACMCLCIYVCMCVCMYVLVKFVCQAQNYNTENIPYLRNSFVNWFRSIVKLRPETDTPTSCVLANNMYFKPTLKIMVFSDVTPCGLVEVTSTLEEDMSFTSKTFHVTVLFCLVIT